MDKMEASRYYQAAGDLHNTQALFNLGLMHEFGDGVEKDFHLSKRFYDQAAVYDSNAKTPSALAVMMLKVCTKQYIYFDIIAIDRTNFIALLNGMILFYIY